MKMLKLLSLAAFATILGFSTLSEATAAPKLARAKKARIRFAPDMRCTIQAFEDAQGMKPVANGATLGYGGGAPKVWVRIIVENGSGKDASNFKTAISVKNNGYTKFGTTDTMSLPGGLAKIYPLVQVPLGKSNKIQASVSVDSGKVISELNESNNACSFSVTANVVH